MFQAYFNSNTQRTSLILIRRDLNSLRSSVTLIVIHLTYLTYLTYLLTIITNRSNIIFIHDNISIHTTYIVRDLLRDLDINIIEKLLYSPNLNLIKNLQGLLKHKLLELFPKLYTILNNDKTLLYLIGATQYTQAQIELEILYNLSVSIHNRVKAIIESQGQNTSYQIMRIYQSS